MISANVETVLVFVAGTKDLGDEVVFLSRGAGQRGDCVRSISCGDYIGSVGAIGWVGSGEDKGQGRS